MEIGKLNETTVWVKYPGKAGDEYEIKYITDDVIRLELIRDRKASKEEGYDERGPEGWYNRVICKAVVNWRGITEGGKPWPCTDENKKKFFSKFIGTRGEFVFVKAKDETLFLGDTLEEDLKN